MKTRLMMMVMTLAAGTAAWGLSTNDLYWVVDLSGGGAATNFSVSGISSEADFGMTNIFKRTHLLLRRMDPGKSPTWGYTITKPFYIGVFEVTEQQWSLVMTNAVYDAAHSEYAKAGVSYSAIRGSRLGAEWPKSDAVDATNFLGRLRAKTGLTFDLPTEAQWEYACRAGTAGAYNNGGKGRSDMVQLGSFWNLFHPRFWHMDKIVHGQTPGVCPVGSYQPNAWGLYDMHGNVWEWCRDWYKLDAVLVGKDPVGQPGGKERVLRGGGYYSVLGGCSSTSRGRYVPDKSHDYGFRVVCPAEMNGR